MKHLSEEIQQAVVGSIPPGTHTLMAWARLAKDLEDKATKLGVRELTLHAAKERELRQHQEAVAKIAEVLDASAWCGLKDQVGGIISLLPKPVDVDP